MSSGIKQDVIIAYFFLNMTNPATDTNSSRTKQMIGPMTIFTM